MQATLTEVQRQARRVFRPVQAGQSVRITEHGRPFARVEPDYPVVTMSAEEFRALPVSDAELDRAINAALKEIRE